jgi:hypothetical protein
MRLRVPRLDLIDAMPSELHSMWKLRVFLGTSLISPVVPSLLLLDLDHAVLRLHGVELVEVALQKPISGLLVAFFLAIFPLAL